MFPRHALPPKRVDWSLRSVHLCYTQPRFPHVKAIMSHGTDAHPDLLLRGELMMIAAVMHTMLLNESYLDHVIMPVSLIYVCSHQSVLYYLLMRPSRTR